MENAIRHSLLAIILLTAGTLHPSSVRGQEKDGKNAPLVYLKLASAEDVPELKLIDRIKPQPGDALVQELCRQSVLLAARNAGQLIIKDEAMGDPEPEKARSDTYLFHVTTNYLPGASVNVQLALESATVPKELWTSHLDIAKDKQTIQQITEYMEDKSRTELEAILKKEIKSTGHVQQVSTKLNQKANSKLLEDLTFLAQFEALRQLHASGSMNEPTTLAALARGYAQLALLTRYHWTRLHHVCQARSLLYAQRLIALHPKESGQSVLGACLSFAGYHGLALTYFDKAEKAGETFAPWVAAGKLNAQFDFQALEAMGAKQDESASELSLFLAFRILAREPTLRHLALTHPAIQLGMKLMEQKPEAYAVINRLCASTTLGLRHHATVAGQETLARTLPARLSSMNGLPGSVKATFQEGMMLRDCPQMLIKEGMTDVHEPSWSCIGNTILQTYFQQVVQRADFMHQGWSVPAKEYLDEVLPLLANHPQATLVNVAGGEKNGGAQPFTFPKTGDVRYFGMIEFCEKILDEHASKAMATRFYNQRTQSADDLALLSAVANDIPVKRVLSKAIMEASPYHPLAPAILFNTGGPEIESLLPEDHVKRYGMHVVYLADYSLWQIKVNRTLDAEKTLKKLVSINPNSSSYNSLANCYLYLNDRAKWEETLLTYLKTPDLGLQSARVRLDIAEYHAGQKNWVKAKQYASEAADTYAAWALYDASRIYERAGDFEQAETYIKNMSTRYNDSTQQWLRWCVRTGKGNRNEALALIKTQMEQKGKLSPNDLMLLGIFHEAMNQPKEALDYFSKAYAAQKHVHVAMHAAIMENELGNKEARDTWMAKALISDKALAAQADYQGQLKINEMIYESYKTNKLPKKGVVEEFLYTIGEQTRTGQYYFLGRTSEQQKDYEMAKMFYAMGMQSKYTNSWHYLLCDTRLRALFEQKK